MAHGAWCWYKVVARLRAAGHRATALDMAASGVHLACLHEVASFEDYSRPLLDAVAAVPHGDRLVLLKKKGGGGSKVVGGVYLQLRDGMVGEYLTVPLNTSLKGWNARWFYMKQSHPAIRCDVDHILKS
ncbi:esterase PIR7B-like [Miscanthus floridulus]|uniref:esterase PIR7B-like n=1 Tax=Miscanthus floridulus TaxID=154761 RepID=UPI003459598C